MRLAVKILAIFAFVAAAMAPGCYTVLKHPTDEGGYAASQTSDCTRCHYDYATFPYGYYYAPYPDYWWQYERFGSYYAYPWWWSYYDYSYNDDNIATESDGRETKFDRSESSTEPMPPPYWHSGHSAFPGTGITTPSITVESPQTIPDTSGQTGSRPTPGDGQSREKQPADQSGGDKTVRQSDHRRPDSTSTTPAPKKDDSKKQTRRRGNRP